MEEAETQRNLLTYAAIRVATNGSSTAGTTNTYAGECQSEIDSTFCAREAQCLRINLLSISLQLTFPDPLSVVQQNGVAPFPQLFD